MANTYSVSNAERTRDRLAYFLVGSFVGVLPLFVFWGMPQTSKDIVTYMVGQLSGMALMALGHYFTRNAGQDSLDEKRADNTAKLVDLAAAGRGEAAPAAAERVARAAVEEAQDVREQQS